MTLGLYRIVVTAELLTSPFTPKCPDVGNTPVVILPLMGRSLSRAQAGCPLEAQEVKVRSEMDVRLDYSGRGGGLDFF